ncbi:tetratricopeptide repeat protein [bacterium]|nr:tetratricopeptide repeat protein [bacterium]
MKNCPEIHELSLLLVDGLSEKEASLRAHLDECASCREKSSKLASLLEVSASEEPPAGVLENLRLKIIEEEAKKATAPLRPARVKSSLKSQAIVWVSAAAALLIFVEVAVSSLLSSRKHGEEASRIAALRTANTQEILFRDGDKEQDGNDDYGLLTELKNTGLIDSVLGSGTKQGYMFLGAYSPKTGELLWFNSGNPALPGSTGDRYFEVNTAGVIYYTTGKSLAMDTSTCTIPNGKRPGWNNTRARIIDLPRKRNVERAGDSFDTYSFGKNGIDEYGHGDDPSNWGSMPAKERAALDGAALVALRDKLADAERKGLSHSSSEPPPLPGKPLAKPEPPKERPESNDQGKDITKFLDRRAKDAQLKREIDIVVDDADLREVMDTIGRRVGRNVVVDPEIHERVTISLRKIPWREAVDVIARRAEADPDGCIRDITKAIELDPKNTDAWAARGLAKVAKGDLDGAIADASRALELDPHDARAWKNRAEVKRLKGDLDGSVADLARATAEIAELKAKLATTEEKFSEYARKSDAEKKRLIDEGVRLVFERERLRERLSETRDYAAGEISPAQRLATTTELRTKAPALLARPDGADQRELPLSALRVSTILMATRARTLIDCTFENPHNTQLQGTLMIRLPEGASPCYLGMFQGAGLPHAVGPLTLGSLLPPVLDDPSMLLSRRIALPSSWYANGASVDWGTLRPAEVVEEKQAKVVYEQVTRRRVDPALMEWSGGNNFSTRIFPIPALSRKRVFFVYDQPAPDLGGRATLALPVPDKLPPAFRLEVAADPRAWQGAALLTAKGEQALVPSGKFLRATLECANEGSFLLVATPRTAAVRAGFGESAGVPGSLVHARISPSVKMLEGRKTGSAVFLLDTSLSQRAKLAPSCGRLLRAILEKDASIERFQVVTFDVLAKPLFEGWRENKPEQRETTLKEVESLWLEGATSLEAGLACLERTVPQGEHPTFFLLSDAQVTWGEEDPRELERAFPRIMSERWICYQIGDSALARPVVERLVRSGGRVVPIVSSQEIDAAALAHALTPAVLRSVHVDGAQASDLVVAGKPRSLFPGEVLEVAFRCPQGVDPRKAAVVVETESGAERFSLETASDQDAVSARAWAELTATSLLDLGDQDADRAAVGLSQAFALANRVASFLILETDHEYKQYQIRTEDLDLSRLTLLAASREERRPIGAPDTKALDARALAFLEKIASLTSTPWQRPSWPKPTAESFDRPKSAFAAGECGGKTGERLDPVLVWSETARRAQAGRGDEALRIVSSIVEESPRDARALRLAGFALMSLGRYEDARAIFARTRVVRPFEPQAHLCEALALEALGRSGEAALRYEIVLAGSFDPRFDRFAKDSARRLYARLLSRIGAAGEERTRELALADVSPFPAHEAHIFWNLDDTDVDLHVRETAGPYEVSYRNMTSPTGGLLHGDNTTGLGPEIYTHPRAEPATISLDYFGTRSVEGTVPAAALLVYFKGDASYQETIVSAAILPREKANLVLYKSGEK